MNPYAYVTDATANGESLLALCAGVGFELGSARSSRIVAVDISDAYVDRLSQSFPDVEAVCADALEYTRSLPDNSFDVVSIIDGIEHLEKEDGLTLIEEMKRVSSGKILLFTPEGFVKNEPHSAWGIDGQDQYQVHRSGWQVDELKSLGFELVEAQDDISQHGEPYRALMFTWSKVEGS